MVCASLCLAVSVAHAATEGPRSLFGQPVPDVPEPTEADLEDRRSQFETMLEGRGWEVHGDVVGPPELFAPNPALQPAPADWNYPPHRATIFLNFFGGEMTNGSNSALMESTCIPSKFNYPGFTGTEAQALAIIDVFESLLAPYGIRVAYEKAPPPELPYAMVMMGGKPGDVGMDPGILGVSCSSDCGDRWWRDTTLAFTAAASPSQTNTLATTALHEAAHAFGLGHIDTGFNSPFVMHPYVDNSEKIWGDQCEEYNDATGSINCQSTHDVWCGGGAQNTHAELMAYFGTNAPDIEPPTVEILAPVDGLELESGSDVAIEAKVTDNHDGAGWKIMIYKDGELVQDQPTFTFETKWGLSGLPAGIYTVRIQAIDHDRNIGADEVTIYVGTQAPTPGGSDTGSLPTTGDGTGSSSNGGEASGSESATTGQGEGGADGCNCNAEERPGASALWLVLLSGLRRRWRTA